jgi:hypothetical protein
MSKLIRNTTTALIELTDLQGCVIEAGETLDLASFDDVIVRTSVSLVQHITTGDIVYNDGAKDFSPNDAISLIRGLQQILQTTDNGKQIVISTPRPAGTFAYFMGNVDDVAHNKVGKGAPLIFNVAPGETQSIRVNFVELIYFIRGICNFVNADIGSYLDQEVWCPAGMPFPAPTNHGNYDIVNGTPVANTTGTGAYYILPTDTLVNKFINKYLLYGIGQATIGGEDVARLFQGWYMNLIIHNASATDTLKAVINMQIYRMRTI